ncbi:MAG: hypothetical protein K0R50_627 [Eubacterium sp.]|jgi:hypothetical protein|nr:hypothetical protein [Eubacterium sp.]
MCIHNRLFALIFRILLLVGCGIGLYLNSGLPSGKPAPYMLIFYTIQSNALCFIFFSLLTVKTFMDLKSIGIKGSTVFLPHFKGAVTMTIAVTFIIYHFVLVPKYLNAPNSNYSLLNWQNVLVHYFVPLAAITDWLVFDEKFYFRWFDPIFWLLLPITYFIFILIRAKLGGIIEIVKSPYPYFFIDVELLGWLKVIKNAGLLMFGFLVLGYILYLIDKINISSYRSKISLILSK